MADDPEPLTYTIRPDKTALWLPASLAERLGLKRGDTLTADQFGGFAVQQLLGERLREQSERGKK